MNSSLPRQSATAEPRQIGQARIAAIGDLHMRGLDDHRVIAGLSDLRQRADLLVVTGDLTENGRLVEAEAAAEILGVARIPVIAILGNHDLRSLRRVAFRRVLDRQGVEVLEGSSSIISLPGGARVGIAGITGSGGGFWPAEGPNAIHARTLRRLAIRARRESEALARALESLETDVRIAAMHFAPTTSTLGREPLAKYWMLGNSELGLVIDRLRPELVFHGHAHLGTLCGHTLGGTPVRNVALPVVGGVYVEILNVEPLVLTTSAAAGGLRSWL